MSHNPPSIAIWRGFSLQSKAKLILKLFQTCVSQACVIVLPSIGVSLNIPTGRLQWVISATSLANATTLLLWGRLADIIGRRRIFQIGLGLISISCLISPFAPDEASFDFFRAVQGLGTAAAIPSAMGIIFGAFPKGKSQVYAISAFSAGFPLGGVLGSVLGGLIAQYLGWRWIFWILAMALAFSAGLAIVFIPPLPKDLEIQASPWKKRIERLLKEMDWVGLLLSMASLMFILVAMSDGNVVGWSTPWIITLLCIGCLLFALFILWQLRLEKLNKRPPLMKLSVFKSPTYAAAMGMYFLAWSAFNNFLVFATYFYQDYQGLDVIQTTLRYLPLGITGLIAVTIVSQLLSRINGYTITLFGATCIATSCLLFAVPIPPDTTYWAYGFPAMVIMTLGVDVLVPCLSIFIMHAVEPEDQGIGAAIYHTLGNVGRTIGLAIATAIQIAVETNQHGNGTSKDALLIGLRAASWFNFACGAAAVCVVAVAFRGCGILGSKK